ncbi:MAG: hypothetical protein WCL44_02245 [bacterium]
MTRFIKTLEKVGRKPVVVQGCSGCRIVVLPHGGRTLGLFPAGSDFNFLWTNPVLDDLASAKAFMSSGQWLNTGGDRTWLAPENDFFRPDYPDKPTYFQPRQLDPGRYRCEACGRGVRLTCDLELRSYRTREDVGLRIVKEVMPSENPFHQVPGSLMSGGVSFAGYSLRSTLELRGKAGRTVVGLWHLLQMPHRGRMLIPVRFRTRPTIYFGKIPKGDLATGARLIEYAMRSPGDHKLGVQAIALTGRAGYIFPCASGLALVVRNFLVNPSGSYADALPMSEECPGDAFQACSVSNSALGHFSELEYHVPAVGGTTGLDRSEDSSQVWAFCGPAGSIRRIASALLGKQDAGN